VRPQYFPREKSRSSQNFRLFAGLILLLLASSNASAQIQQAWVARYNNGITNGTNKAVKMALDSNGNIIVVGVSQNTNNELGYVTIKYAPNGDQLWVARYDSTNFPTAAPTGMVLDISNNVIVTGTANTMKYDPNGNQVWNTSQSGASIAVDAQGDAYVTGCQSGPVTMKISPAGSNLWSKSFYSDYGPALLQMVVVDGGGNAYVAGSETNICYPDGSYESCYCATLLAKYSSSGELTWDNVVPSSAVPAVQIGGFALDSSTNIYVVANTYFQPWTTFAYTSDGGSLWSAQNPDAACGSDAARGLAVDSFGDAFTTGLNCYFAPDFAYATSDYGTYKANANGQWLWTNTFPTVPVVPSAANALALDLKDNCYVTGYSSGPNGTNNIVTIKYGPSGNQLWLQSYNGLNAGNDAGNAIAVDKNGNVYVTGYETLPGGGTGIVTIKYSPLSIQRQTNGTVLIETQGSPGESFDIQASWAHLNFWGGNLSLDGVQVRDERDLRTF
jgi:hypothetical protein